MPCNRAFELKPHLYRISCFGDLVWLCVNRQAIGVGDTPCEAYDIWASLRDVPGG